MITGRVASLFGCVFLFSSAVFAEGHLQLTLMPSDSNNPTKMTLTLTNDGDAPISFDKYSTPLALLGEISTSFNQFTVTDVNSPDNEEAAYMGMVAHTPSLQVSRFVTLDAGQSLVAQYDLWPNYLLMPGKTYAVTFNMVLGYGPRNKEGNAIPSDLHIPSSHEIKSNEIHITIPITHPDRLKDASKSAKSSLVIQALDDDKMKILDDAVFYAWSYMTSSAYVNYRDGLPPFNESNGKSIDSPPIHAMVWNV